MGLRRFTIVIDEKYTEDVTMAFLRYAESFSFENVEDQPGFDLGEASPAELRKLGQIPKVRKKRSPNSKHARGGAYHLILEKARRVEQFAQSEANTWMTGGGYSAGSVYATLQTLVLDGFLTRTVGRPGEPVIYYPTEKAKNRGEQAA